jgi:hypothetical protein
VGENFVPVPSAVEHDLRSFMRQSQPSLDWLPLEKRILEGSEGGVIFTEWIIQQKYSFSYRLSSFFRSNGCSQKNESKTRCVSMLSEPVPGGTFVTG